MKKKSVIFLFISGFVILLIVLFNSYSNNSYEFPLKISLRGKVISNPDLNFPLTLEVIDTFIIIFERPFQSKFIKILSKESYHLITSTGIIGRGPGEIVNPAVHTADDKNRLFWISDWGTYKIWKFPLDSVIRNSSYIPSYYIPISPRLMPLINLKCFTPELFAYTGFNELISFIDHEGVTIDSLGIRNNLKIDFWDEKTVSDIPYIINFHPQKNKIAIASRNLNFLAAIDINGQELFSVNGSDIKHKTIETDWDRIVTYVDVATNDKYIFCLYSGREMGVWNKERTKHIPNYPNNIYVFNWKGKPIANIELDHPLFSIAVDGRKGIFGIATDLDFSLIYYDLPIELTSE